MTVKLYFVDTNVSFGGSQLGSLHFLKELERRSMCCKVIDVYGASEKYKEIISEMNLDSITLLKNVDPNNYVLNNESFIKKVGSFVCQLPIFKEVVGNLRETLKNENPDFILVNNYKTLLPVVLSSLGLPVKVIIYHRVWVRKSDLNFLNLFLMRKYCDYIISHAKDSVANLKTFLPNKNVHYIPNAVETHLKPQSNSNEVFTIILPGARPTRLKGYDCAIEAINHYCRNNTGKVRLILTGEIAVGHSQEFFTHLNELIAAYGLKDTVEFIGWRDDILELINRSDLVILPSHTEGFPRVIIESMLLKTPVIATPVGGIPDAIIDRKTGFLVEIDDYVKLSEAISIIKDNNKLTSEIIENAFSYAQKHFDKDIQADNFVKIIKDEVN